MSATLIHADARWAIPRHSFDLVFTSPPYNVGIDYESHDDLMAPNDWKHMVKGVLGKSWDRLRPGGRMVVDVIPLAGRNPPYLIGYEIQDILNRLPRGRWMGQVVWDKASGTGSSTAWGSWRSARSPVFRGEYEMLYVIAKETTTREDIHGESDTTAREFNLATREVWRDITTASAWTNEYPHPVPFPPALAERVVRLLTVKGDRVLDPFMGRGTTVMVAESMGRKGTGIDVSLEYVSTASRLLEDNLIEHVVSHFDCGCEAEVGKALKEVRA